MKKSSTKLKKTTSIKTSLIFLLGICIFGCNSDRINYLRGDVKPIFALAAKENKKVFVLITDSLCESCKAFEEFLNNQRGTVESLKKEYICYKVDIRKPNEKLLAEILKCPSYPFPYFFDQNGKLLTFGFPNTPTYDISNLDSIYIAEKKFSELFRLPIKVDEYKKMVSLNLAATLISDNGSKSLDLKAYKLYKKSLDIASYPYNIKHYMIMHGNLSEKKKIPLKNYEPSKSDLNLYGNLNKYFENANDLKSDKDLIEESYDYSVNAEKIDLKKIEIGNNTKFNFTITNNSPKLLTISDINHPCDCLKIFNRSLKLVPKESRVIHCSFTPYQSGAFSKDIFIHSTSSSGKEQMKVIEVFGIVN